MTRRMIRQLLVALAVAGSVVAGVVPVLAQGTVIPRTCSQAIPSASLASGTTTALIGPGATIPATMPTGGPAAANLTSGNPIAICGYTINAVGASTVQLEYGPGSTCSQVSPTINPVPLTPAWSLPATSVLTDNADYFRGLAVPPGQTLCVVVGGTGAAQILVYYNNLVP